MCTRLFAALLIVAGLAPAIAARGNAPTFDQAMKHYERGNYLKAEEGLRAAAEGGNLRAQELLGYMYISGPRTYPGIALNPHEAAVWFERAARGGSASARYMYCSLTRHASTYRIRTGPCFVDRRDSTDQAERD